MIDREDAQLALAAQRGEKAAFVDIVARHQAMVTGVTLAILGNFQASEDAAQEAFVTAWQKISSLKHPEKLRSWLAQIARNTALMHRRKQRPDEPLESIELIDQQLGPDERVASREEQTTVLEALEALPEKFRLPLILFYREDKSIRAVASALNLTEDVVKKRLGKGRELLRSRVARLIDSVVRQTVPGAVFTTTVAGLIGAMVKPAALASTAFSASQTAPPLASATTVMTTSKFTLTTAAVITAVCLPIGYAARFMSDSWSHPELLVSSSENHDSDQMSYRISQSTIITEWRTLWAEYQGRPAELHQVLEEMPDSLRKQAFHLLLAAEWARLDPEGGADFYNRRDWSQKKAFYESWIRIDHVAAFPRVARLARSFDFLQTYAEVSPEYLGKLLGEMRTGINLNSIPSIFEIAGNYSLEEARLAAENVDERWRDEALRGVARAWGARDVDAALEWASKFQNQTEQRYIIDGILHALAKEEPFEALSRIDLLISGRPDDKRSLLQTAAAADFDKTLDWWVQNSQRVSGEGLAEAIHIRLKEDPVSLLTSLEGKGVLFELSDTLFSSRPSKPRLSPSENEKIWKWLIETKGIEGEVFVKSRFLNHIGYRQPKQMMTLIDQMPSGEERQGLVAHISEQIMQQRPQETSLDDMDRLISESSREWQIALSNRVFNWFPFDEVGRPEVWLSRWDLLEEQKRPLAAWQMGGFFAKEDPERLAQWMPTLKTGAERAMATSGAVRAYATSDPEAAWKWMAQMESPEMRGRAVEQILKPLAQEDMTTALEWLQRAPLSEEQKQKILPTLQETSR